MATKKAKSKKQKATPKVSQKTAFWTNRQLTLPILGILAITFGLFSSTLQYDFVNWDDPLNILENPHLQTFDWESIQGIFSSTVIGNYNPLTILTFAIEKAIFGLNPMVFHLNNVLLHLVCVFLVYRIALLLNLSPIAAALVAILFGIHPMRVESVAWITERKDVLFGAFYLGAIFQYIRYLNSNRTNQKIFASVIFLFVLSLFSKIQAVALPLSFLTIDYWLKRPINWGLIIEKIPYFLLSLAVGLLGVFLLSSEGALDELSTYTFIDRLFIGGYSYLVYLAKFIFPYTMSPIYGYPESLSLPFYVGTAVSISIVGGVIYGFTKGYRVLVFAFAFFTVNVFFVLQIIGAGQGFLADRFTYIPYLGLFIGLAYLYEKGVANKSLTKLLPIGVGWYLFLFAYTTWQQNKIWQNGETLWTHAINYDARALTPWTNRADYYQDTKQLNLALKDYEKALTIDPEKGTLYNSWGKTLFDMGQIPQALEKYNAGIAKPKPFGEIYINRGVAHAAQRNFPQALKDIDKGLALDENNANGYLNRGLIYYSTNQLAKVIPDLNTYFSMKSGTSEQWYILGLSYRNTGDAQSAISAYNNALQINPTDKRFYNSRANAYQALGKQAEAAQDLETAKRL